MNSLDYFKNHVLVIFLLDFCKSFEYVKNTMNDINTLPKTTFSGRRFTRKQVVPTKQCRSIISMTYDPYFHGCVQVKSIRYAHNFCIYLQPALLCRDYQETIGAGSGNGSEV